ncbi:MAG: PepSY domain-containing protein [Rhodobacteraceae bacterium]|nr:PepSY domain-containing protein [Paracoccaceae bacterium]
MPIVCTGAPLAAGGRSTRSPRRVWWLVHQWSGLKLALFSSFVFLTGTLAVFGAEFDWLLQPALRVAPEHAPAEPNWAAIAMSAAADPMTARIIAIEAPHAAAFAGRVSILRTDGRRAFLYAHPATGEIQGLGPWAGAQRILRNLHRHLNLPTRIGVPIVSALSIPLAITFVTAFVVYPKWWHGFFRPIRWRDARTAWGDLHRLIGVWSLWFCALIALTGGWYFVESLGLDAPQLPLAKIHPGTSDTATTAARLGDSIAAAHAVRPDLKIVSTYFPTPGSGAFRIMGETGNVFVRPRANTVWVDPATAKVILIGWDTDLTFHQQLSEIADPLHFGTVGGYWTKALWFLFGLILTGLSISGAAIYACRIAGTNAAIKPNFGARLRSGMGRWLWLSAVLIAIGIALIPAVIFQSAE